MNNDVDALKHILDESNEMIQVFDRETHSLLYANTPAREREWSADLVFPLLHADGDTGIIDVDRGDAIFAMKSRCVKWNGRDAIVTYAWDVTDLHRSERIYKSEVDAIIKSIGNARGMCHLDLDDDKVLSVSTGLSGPWDHMDLSALQLVNAIAGLLTKEEQRVRFLTDFSSENLHRIYAKGINTLSMDTNTQHGDGPVMSCRFTVRLLSNPRNSHLECIAFTLDVREEIAMRREMEITNKLNEALASDFGTIFILNLNDGTMRIRKMSLNQNAQKLNLPDVLPFDYFFEQYARSFILEEYQDELLRNINVASLRRRVEQGGGNFTLRFKVRPNATGERNFEAVVFKVMMDDVCHLVVGCKCIDKLIEREEYDKQMLMESRAQAEAANRAKTSFLFNMSHDIRTPMNAIMGFTNLLEKHHDDSVRRVDYLKKISESSKILLSIINNVLEMARIEKGALQLDESAWSVDMFNESICTLFDDMMKEKDIEFTHRIGSLTHRHVLCDPTKTREIFFNIISNAYKYTPSGGRVDIMLEELPSDREGYALFRYTITDTGRGMSEDFLPHIFEEFSREQNTTLGKVEGTGLGMPIVKRLVEMMGGDIEVRSEMGVGTSVIVTLPHRFADEANIVSRYGVELDPRLFLGKRILLAEDNDLNAEIAMEILSEAGFVVERACDGRECVDMLETAACGYYDLVLMDIQMPNMNGYEATRHIRTLEDETKAAIPVLAMTANAFDEDRHEAIRCGMNAHIAKPIDVQGLMKSIASTL